MTRTVGVRAVALPLVSNTEGPSARVADAIVAQLAPRTVLDAGCGLKALVSDLRDRGVDATAVEPGALSEPLGGPYDLVVCVDVAQRLDPADAAAAVAHLAAAGDRVLFASSPLPGPEDGGGHALPVERWSQLFAAQGLLRDFRHDAAYVSPWAVLYRRQDLAPADLVLDYDRAWAELRAETLALREALAEATHKLATQTPAAEVETLRKEILRLRDLVVGREAELATALGQVAEMESMVGRYDNVEQRLHAVLESRSWRLGQLLTSPTRLVRGRGRR